MSHFRQHASTVHTDTHIYSHTLRVDIPKRWYAHRGVRIRSKKSPGGEKGNRRAPKIFWPTAKHPTPNNQKPLDSTISTPSRDLRTYLWSFSLVFTCVSPLSLLRFAPPALILKFHFLALLLPFYNCSLVSFSVVTLTTSCHSCAITLVITFVITSVFRCLSWIRSYFRPSPLDDLVRCSVFHLVRHSPVFVKRAVCSD